MSKQKQLRAVPVQARSRRRYEAVLDAAGEVFAERGFQAATMQEIADGAETSIGSVYRFFPDKKSVFTALMERMATREEALLETLMSSAFSSSLPELVGRAVDLYAALQWEEPGWRAVWMNLHLYEELGDSTKAIDQKQFERIEQLVGFYASGLDEKRRKVVASTIFDYLTGMLSLYIRHDESMHEALLEETKRMLLMYAKSIIEEGAG